MTVDINFFTDSDQEFLNSIYTPLANLSPEIAYGLVVSIALPITITAINIFAKYMMSDPRPKMNVEVRKIDLENQTSAKIKRICSAVGRSSLFGFRVGRVVFLAGLTAAAVALAFRKYAVPIFSSYLSKCLRVNTLQWFPSKDNHGLLTAIGAISVVASASASIYNLVSKAIDQCIRPTHLALKPIFSEKINSIIDELIIGNRNAREHRGAFSNLLLSGPPGTGKTLLAKWIAENSKMNYIMMSGSDLTQFINKSTHVTELNQLFKRINGEENPTVLFIDEAESVLMNRNNSDNIHYKELLHAFLKQVGESSHKFMLILATNRYEDLDKAVLDRMDFKLEIPLPSTDERRDILENLIQQLFSQEQQLVLFPSSKIDELAEETKGFSGRMIMKMINFLVSMNRDPSSDIDLATKRYIERAIGVV